VEQQGQAQGAPAARAGRRAPGLRLVLIVAGLAFAVIACIVILLSAALGDDPRDVTEEYFEALGKRDGKKACSLMTESFRERRARVERKSCAEAQTYTRGGSRLERARSAEIVSDREVKLRRRSYWRVRVRTRARGDTDTTTVTLRKEDGKWRVNTAFISALSN
jgi:hypothetical protein